MIDAFFNFITPHAPLIKTIFLGISLFFFALFVYYEYKLISILLRRRRDGS